MNQNPVGIGMYQNQSRGCGCGTAPRAMGQNSALSEATWVLGVGAVIVLGIAAVVVAQSFKQAGF